MRTLIQPGPRQTPRIQVAVAAQAEELLVELPAGADLIVGLTDALAGHGLEQAGVRLLGGVLGRCEYYTGVPDPSGWRVATYGPPTPLAGPARCLAGNAILGRGAGGEPLVHCHAVILDATGRVHGGHLNPGGCTVGAGGLLALACAWSGPGFAVRFDPETNYPVFHAEAR